MAQQMITLEEAAEILGLSVEEMKKRLKTDPEFKRLSQIRDGSTVRFKQSAIEELGRQLGMASDHDLTLAPMADELVPGSDDFKVPPKSKKPADDPLEFDSSENDVFSLSDEPRANKPKSSGKLTPSKPAAKSDLSDSADGSSDSDVRLKTDKPKKDGSSEESAVPTEEISLDFSGPGSAVIKGGSSAKLSAPKSPSGKLTAGDSGKVGSQSSPDSSEFELSLDADSDDFDLQMEADSSDEVDLGTMPKSGKTPGKSGGKSGINLRDPADSGIPIGKGEKKGDDSDSSESDLDFELSLDASALTSSTKLGAPKSGKLVLDSDSDSEFELTLDDSGASSLEHAALEDAGLEDADKGDIFETDFEIPPMPDDSASEAVVLESDTDLESGEFATEDSDLLVEESDEVAPLTDEDEVVEPVARAAKPKKKRRGDDEDDASSALAGVRSKRRTDEDEDEETEAVPAGAVVERPTKPWGIVPVLFLAPSLLVVLLGAVMGYELLNTMWGYQQPRKPAAPLIRGIASNLDMELRDQ